MTTPQDKINDEFIHLCNTLKLDTDQMRGVADMLSDEAFARDRFAREQKQELKQSIDYLEPIMKDLFSTYLAK